jgi:hypothetical protein
MAGPLDHARRYWSGWSSLPPPPQLQPLGWFEREHTISLHLCLILVNKLSVGEGVPLLKPLLKRDGNLCDDQMVILWSRAYLEHLTRLRYAIQAYFAAASPVADRNELSRLLRPGKLTEGLCVRLPACQLSRLDELHLPNRLSPIAIDHGFSGIIPADHPTQTIDRSKTPVGQTLIQRSQQRGQREVEPPFAVP